MKLSNHDLVLRGLLRVLPPQLERFARRELAGLGSRQAQALSAGTEGGGREPVDLADLSTQIRVLTARTEGGRPVFRLPPGLGAKLREVRRFRNDVVHGRDLDPDQVLAALVAVSETLRLINAPAASREEVRELIRAIDGHHGTGSTPDAPDVEVVECPRVLGYAHAVAGLRLPVRLRLRGAARPDDGRPPVDDDPTGRGSDAVTVRLTVIEYGGALELTASQTVRLSGDEQDPAVVTVDLPLNRHNLLQVERAGRAELRVEMHAAQGWTPVASNPHQLALAPRQWQLADAPSWTGPALATFVQPDDGAVEELAHEALRACLSSRAADEPLGPATTRTPGESGAPVPSQPAPPAPGPDALVDAVCACVRRRRLTIHKPTAPWRARPHAIATPTELLEAATGTTLDAAVLLAAVLERLSVATTLALTEDGALVAYDRGPSRTGALPGVRSDDGAAALAARVAEGRTGLIDPQLAARSPAAVLHRLGAAARGPALEAVAAVVLEVPLAQARREGVVPQPRLERQEDDLVVERTDPPPRPLPSIADVAGAPVAGAAAQGRAAPSPAALPAPAPEEPTRPVPAEVERWKRLLLDLSVRNPLIHRDPRKAVELMVPRSLLGVFEDLVNGAEKILLRAVHGGPARSAARAQSLLEEERAVEIDMSARDYRRRLGALASEARVTVEETGANNLYLALGTLTWTSHGSPLRSPLVLVPVTLKRDEDAFYLIVDQAGASTPNYSLLARFTADTGIDLPDLREPARDEHGIDVDAVLKTLASRLRRARAGASVEATAHLGLFRFSTHRVWQDLNEHWTELGAHPLVSRIARLEAPTLVAGAGLSGSDDVGTDLDELVENLPLDADASQADVIARAVTGHSLVVEGPPGTGKSQTVVNLVFHALRQGRSVMFVAEKASALDVVARRLREETGDGVGSLLLNLHDNRVRPSDVREALRGALAVGAPEDPGPGLAALRTRLSRSRARLNEYRRALHGRGADGLSYYQAHQALVGASDDEQTAAGAALDARARAVGLEDFDEDAQARLIDDYRDGREQLRQGLPAELLSTVVRRRDAALDAAGQRAEDLRHEIGLRRSSMGIRELMSTYGDLITAITPCLLVSPDSVARFLPVGRVNVDMVVFDEASQITVPAAVGAIGRGRSAVVVGDRKQMPPPAATNRGALEDGDDGATPSILDRCREVGVMSRRLEWHYRSQVESLIAFSNRHYYDGGLQTFPSPLTLAERPDPGPRGFGVSWRQVRGRYYPDKAGTGRARPRELRPHTNPVEAHEVVEEVLRRFEASADRIPSLGVLTLNVRQRDLIEDQLRETGSSRVVEALDAPDGLLVRNLDNIQGEERDTILFSLTFSTNDRGDVPLNFGSLSHQGGERRLNVAITRARRQMVVFSSFDPEDLHAERAAYQGVKDLRRYLEMARSGRVPRARAYSPAEVDVSRDAIAQELRASGLDVSTGVGHSGFAIDMVLTPTGGATAPGVAVLLDGPGWAQRGTVADRDLMPVDVLRRMGWSRVERVWLPQWVKDPRGVIESLLNAAGVRQRAATSVGAGAAQAPAQAAPVQAEPAAVQVEPVTPRAPAVSAAPPAGERAQDPEAEKPEPREVSGDGSDRYESWQPAGVLPTRVLDDAEKDPAARARVVEVARSICDVEAPLTMHRLVVKLCRAFGLSRTTASREARVRAVLGQSFAYVDNLEFVWRTHDASLVPMGYRRGALDHVASIEEIHPRELTALMADVLSSSVGWESPDDLCQAALRRLSSKKRKLGARGVKTALTQALKAAEAANDE